MTHRGPRLWVLDPGFQDVAGHHYELNRAIVADCARRGIGVRIAAHREIQGEAATLPVSRVFSNSIYDEYYNGGDLEPIRRQCLADLAALPADWGWGPRDVLLVHSVAIAHFLALGDWLGERLGALPARQRPRCVILHTVGWFGGEWTAGRYPWSTLFRQAAARLASLAPLEDAAGAAVTFAAVNEPLCRDWALHAGQPAAVHPIPCPVLVGPRGTGGAGGADGSDRALRFAFLGGARREKGFELLPEVVWRLARSCPEIEMVIQVAAIPATSRHTVDQLRALARDWPALRLVWGAASATDYRHLLGAADVVLHPYDPLRYHARGSGVFFETMAAGRPMVLPADTWMAEEWRRLDAGGALFDEWSAEAVAAAAAAVARSHAEQRARSLLAAELWTSRHSVAAFVDFVLGAPPAPPPTPPAAAAPAAAPA